MVISDHNTEYMYMYGQQYVVTGFRFGGGEEGRGDGGDILLIGRHSLQCFIQRVGNLGFPTPKLKLPLSSFADFYHIPVLLPYSRVPYLAIWMILCETLPRFPSSECM